MLTKEQEEIARSAGKFDFLQTYIEIKLNVYRDSLKRHEAEMKKILKDDSQSWLINFQQKLIDEAKAKIEILEELIIK